VSIAAKLILLIAVFVGGMGAGVKFHAGLVAERDLKATQEAAKVQIRRMDNIDAAANAHEKVKQVAKVRERIVVQEVERVIEKPVYRNVCMDDDGLRILSDDIASRNASGKPAPAVPGPSGAIKK
jgi:hypothetical protein